MLRIIRALVPIAVLLAACGGSTAPASKSAAASGKPAIGSASAASPAATSSSASAGSSAAASGSPASTTSASAAAQPSIQPLAQRATLRLSLNPAILSYLPIYLALDRGTFKQAGLDIQVITYPGSSLTQLPLLAKGDQDLGLATPAPGLFNQVAQGFNIKAIAPLNVPKAGRYQDAILMVEKDQADKIKELKDLKGKTVEASLQGAPVSLLALEAISQAGLTPGKDVTVTYRAKTPPDMVAIAKAKGADVISMLEPLATQAEKQGFVVRWKDLSDLAPWYQNTLLLASGQILEKNPAAVEKFLEVLLLTSRQINATNGEWTDEFLQATAKRANVAPQFVKDQGGVPYYEPNGALNLDSMKRVEDFWVSQKLVTTPVDPQKVIDADPMKQAVAKLGQAS